MCLYVEHPSQLDEIVSVSGRLASSQTHCVLGANSLSLKEENRWRYPVRALLPGISSERTSHDSLPPLPNTLRDHHSVTAGGFSLSFSQLKLT